MNSQSRFPGGVYFDNPHIILATILALAVFAFHENWQSAYAVLGALLVLGLFVPFVVRILSFLARCAAPLLLGVLIVMVYFTLHAQPNKLEVPLLNVDTSTVQWMLESAKFNDDYKEVFYQAISTLYAIIVGLALVKGIEDVGEAKKILAQEVYVVRSIWSYLKYFEPDENTIETTRAKQDIRRHLLNYTGNVGDGRDTKDEPENRDILDTCRTRILELEPYDRDDRIAQQEIIREFEKLGVLRAQRIGNIGGKISRFLLAALWMMSLALILPFLAEPLCVNPETDTRAAMSSWYIQSPSTAARAEAIQAQPKCPDAADKFLNPDRFSQYYMIFIMVSFFSFLMLMLHDISNPDNGFWRVDLLPFQELNSELGSDEPGLLAEEEKAINERLAAAAAAAAAAPTEHFAAMQRER